MCMIRHQNPSQHGYLTKKRLVFKASRSRTAYSEIIKHSFSFKRCSGDKINTIGYGYPAFAQSVMALLMIACKARSYTRLRGCFASHARLPVFRGMKL